MHEDVERWEREITERHRNIQYFRNRCLHTKVRAVRYHECGCPAETYDCLRCGANLRAHCGGLDSFAENIEQFEMDTGCTVTERKDETRWPC